jgi:hypothetical protein
MKYRVLNFGEPERPMGMTETVVDDDEIGPIKVREVRFRSLEELQKYIDERPIERIELHSSKLSGFDGELHVYHE